jgi:alkyl hydroperoxide reductase subunit AhpC
MSLKLGDLAPNFEQDSTVGPINFYEYTKGRWVILFSHPADFTPVCTTELAQAARLQHEFDKRGVMLLGLSVDPVTSHEAWMKDIEQVEGVSVNFPIIADHDRKVSELYGMIHPNADNTYTVRTVFILDPMKRVRLTFTYPMGTGRNFQEILRVVDSLQLSDSKKVATPADWQPGDPVIIAPVVSDEQARELFPQGWEEKRPYYRVTKI